MTILGPQGVIPNLRIVDSLRKEDMGRYMRYPSSQLVSPLDVFRSHWGGTIKKRKILELTVHQLFARKIIRVFGAITRAEIENEGRLISSFLENGGHENIVTVTSHGWIRDFYFIDMELCDLTLQDYIAYFDGLLSPPFEIIPQLSPVFVEKNCSPTLKIQNIWTIGMHIARGLEFMHGKGQVHRDLKPRNGTTQDIYRFNC